jgi:hypothetical protein
MIIIININLNIAAKKLVGNKGKYSEGNTINSYNKMEEVESLYLILWQQQAVVASVSFSKTLSVRAGIKPDISPSHPQFMKKPSVLVVIMTCPDVQVYLHMVGCNFGCAKCWYTCRLSITTCAY